MRVLILGSGLAGITAAYYLRNHGCEVVVVDRAASAGRETSFANGGMITPSLADPWNAPGVFGKLLHSLGREDSGILLRARQVPSLLGWGIAFLRNASRARFERNYLCNIDLVHYSQQMLRELMHAHPLRFDHAGDGTLQIFRDSAALDHGTRTAQWLQQAGIDHRALDPAGVLGIEPGLAPVIGEIVGGIHYPGDETGNAWMFCEELRSVCAAMGVQFRFAQTVGEIMRKHRRVEGVQTNAEVLSADAYLLAAGSYSSLLCRQLGFELPVRPVKGYSISVPMDRWDARPRVALVDDSLHAVLAPLGNVLRVAGTAEFAGYDTSVNPRRIANLVKLFARVYPTLAGRVDDFDIQPWCGLRPMTPDGRPIIGRSLLDNLFFNTGHGALGWSMACGSGKAAADIICGVPTGMDMGAFTLGRF